MQQAWERGGVNRHAGPHCRSGRLLAGSPCCAGATVLPLRQMAQKRGQQRLCEVLPLLSCKQCKGPAARVWLNETFNRTDISKGAPPGWSVQLVPPLVLGMLP